MSYKESDRMIDVICDHPELLQMMCRFGIPLGVGELTVEEICKKHGIDTMTFLAVANFMKQGTEVTLHYIEKVSVECLMNYLRQAHDYFLQFQLPSIRRKLLEAIDCSPQNEVPYLILKFYDQYSGEVRKHMLRENQKIFIYVENLLQGHRSGKFEIDGYARTHENIDQKMQELRGLIIKYYTPTEKKELLGNVLLDLFSLEADLHHHQGVEDFLFIPAVRLLEEHTDFKNEDKLSADKEEDAFNGILSKREREIVALFVKGLNNKQIADHLCISTSTVQTHRKNIFRKLDIHSTAGLTIYAIVNKIVQLEDIQ